MILSTHSVVGAGTAYALTGNPFIAFIIGFLSHFVLDAMPHWEYSFSDNFSSLNIKSREFWLDGGKIFLDFLGGFLLVLIFIQDLNGFDLVIWLGLLGGVLPDAMQFIGFNKRFKFFAWFKKMHGKIHCDFNFLDRPVSGFLFQAILVISFLL